jgi:hypothetical protein
MVCVPGVDEAEVRTAQPPRYSGLAADAGLTAPSRVHQICDARFNLAMA